MIRILLLLLLAASATPAEAHKLKVFATVEGGSVRGYAFFVGGGRARGTAWVAKDGAGQPVAAGTTDGEGRFDFAVPPSVESGIEVTVDTHEGHVASATLPASRFGPVAGASSAAPGIAATTRQPSAAADLQPPDGQVAVLVEAAVQRQIEPLMERIEEMDSRLRTSDIVSGVFLILGLAGMGLWATGRRK